MVTSSFARSLRSARANPVLGPETVDVIVRIDGGY